MPSGAAFNSFNSVVDSAEGELEGTRLMLEITCLHILYIYIMDTTSNAI